MGIWKAIQASCKLQLRQWLRDKGVLGNLFQYDRFFYSRQMKRLHGFEWKEHIKSREVLDGREDPGS